MFLTKVRAVARTAAGVLLAVVLAGPGVGILTYRTLVAGQPGEAPEAAAGQAPTASDAARVAKLVDELGSETFAEREKATEELDQIGAAALDALRKATRGDDPERARRAEELVQKIEKRALEASLLAPTRVRLVYKDTPLAEAVADFKRQSGYELTLSDPQGKLKGGTVTLDTGDVTFWQALDQFCRKAGLVEAAPPRVNTTGLPPLPTGPSAPVPGEPGRAGGGPGESRIILIGGKTLALPTDDRTAVRVRAERARTSDDREIRFPLQITSEPKLRQLEIVAINIKKATDNQGQSLEPVSDGRKAPPLPGVNRPLLPELPALPRQDPGASPALVRLKKGAKSATALSELSGTITARGLLEARPEGKSVTFDIPFTLKDVPLP